MSVGDAASNFGSGLSSTLLHCRLLHDKHELAQDR